MGRYTLERWEAAAGGYTRPAAGTYTLDRFDRTFGKDGRRYTTARFDAVFGSQSGRGEVYGPPAPTPEQKRQQSAPGLLALGGPIPEAPAQIWADAAEERRERYLGAAERDTDYYLQYDVKTGERLLEEIREKLKEDNGDGDRVSAVDGFLDFTMLPEARARIEGRVEAEQIERLEADIGKAKSLQKQVKEFQERQVREERYLNYDIEAGRQELERRGYTPEKLNRVGGLFTGASDDDKQIAKDIREAEFIQKRAKAAHILDTEPEVAEQIRDAYDLLHMFVDDGISPERVTELVDRIGRSDGWLERLQNMREDILNQLAAQGYDTETLMDIYIERLNQQKAQADKERIEKEAKEIGPGILHGFGAVLAGPEKLRGALYAVGKAAEEFVTGEKQYVDPNSPLFDASRYQSTVREAQTENAPGWGKFLYYTGMSAVDFLAALPFGGVGATAIMASSAAGDTAYELAQTGASAGQIALTALAAGVVEALCEKVSIDQLKVFAKSEPGTIRKLLANTAKGFLTEGTEEAVTELANALADKVISELTGGQNASERAILAYVQQGVPYDEARRLAERDFAKQVALSFLGGGVTGSLLSFGVNLIGYVQSGGEQKNTPSSKTEGANNGGMDVAVSSDGQTADRQAADNQAAGKQRGQKRGAQQASIARTDGDTSETAPAGIPKDTIAELLEDVKRPDGDRTTMPPATGQEAEAVRAVSDAAAVREAEGDPVWSAAERIAQLGDKRVVRHATLEGRSGYYDPTTRTLHIAEDSWQSQLFVVKHELTHSLQGTPEYDRLMRWVMEESGLYRRDVLNPRGIDLPTMQEAKRLEYARQGIQITPEQAKQELLADYVGRYLFTDETSIQRLAREHRSIAQRLLDFLRRVGRWCSGEEQRELLRAERRFRQALTAGGGTSGEVQFSIQQSPDGRRYVRVDTDQALFEGKTVEEMVKIAKAVLKERFQGTVLEVGESGRAYVKKRSTEEYTFPAKRRQQEEIKAAKMRASTELDNLLAVSDYLDPDTDDGRHPQATHGWEFYRTRFEVDGEMFSGTVKIMHTDRGYVFYDITQIKKEPPFGG